MDKIFLGDNMNFYDGDQLFIIELEEFENGIYLSVTANLTNHYFKLLNNKINWDNHYYINNNFSNLKLACERFIKNILFL